MKLKDKVAIITGASRGIGKAIAITLAREGATIVVAARSDVKGRLPGTIHETAEEIVSFGGTALPVKTDISKEEEIQDMVKKTLREFARIDILVNNAAVGHFANIEDTLPRHWELVLRVNLSGPFLLMKAVLPVMKQQKSGSILNISSRAAAEMLLTPSTVGSEPRTIGTAYGVSKVGLERLTMGLAAELKEGSGIVVNALRPATTVRTEGLEILRPEVDKSAWASPYQYMTKAALFLVSDALERGFTGNVYWDRELCGKYSL